MFIVVKSRMLHSFSKVFVIKSAGNFTDLFDSVIVTGLKFYRVVKSLGTFVIKLC